MPEFLKNHHVVAAITETNATQVNITGGQSGDWISMKGYQKLQFLILTEAWAAGTSAITLQQATNIAGGSAKALTYAKHWVSTTYPSEAAPLWVQTAGTLTLPNTANQAYLIEVDADSLDADNGFDCVQIVFGTPGANADYLQCPAILSEPRYGGLESQMVDPVAN